MDTVAIIFITATVTALVLIWLGVSAFKSMLSITYGNTQENTKDNGKNTD